MASPRAYVALGSSIRTSIASVGLALSPPAAPEAPTSARCAMIAQQTLQALFCRIAPIRPRIPTRLTNPLLERRCGFAPVFLCLGCGDKIYGFGSTPATTPLLITCTRRFSAAKGSAEFLSEDLPRP